MVKPKKHLGQHFLKDDNIALKIVSSLSPHTKNLIEIGPGTGVLTKHLLLYDFHNYYVIEVDVESVEFLKAKYPAFAENVIRGDFLKFDLDAFFPEEYSVIGNFPYNISSQILFRILDDRTKVTELVGMFQKEVADRVASPPGSKKYGILSVLVQAYYQIDYLFTVHEHVFHPPPKVKSAVIRLKRNDQSKLPCNEQMFFSLVKAGFNQRRKTLRNALGIYQFKSTEKITFLLNQRAEQLNVQDFVCLVQHIKENK